MPYNIKEQPTLTFVARQHGEAWNRPFVAVYEPSTQKEPSAIQSVSYFDAEEPGLKDFAGICVESKNGRTDIFLFDGFVADRNLSGNESESGLCRNQ